MSEDFAGYDDWKCTPPEYEAREPGCLCHQEAGDSPCPVHGEDEPSYYTPQPIGPCLPIAFCKSCHTQLTFERVTFNRWPRPSPTGWRCHCEGCVDGEYVGDPSTLQMSVRSGEGYTIWQALTDCAYMHFDCEPEELLVAAKEG